MSWAWDAPSGTYKDHDLSSKIRMEAIADAQFMNFVSTEPGYGKKSGETVNITRIGSLSPANRVAELDRLPSNRPSIDTVAITVTEWGSKIPVTNFEQDLTHFDIKNPFQSRLRDQMKHTLDVAAADAFKATLIKAIPTSASAITWDTDGTPSSTATSNLTVAHLRLIHDYMRQTLKVPPFRNGRYIGIVSTRAARGLKNDSEYKDWLSPTTSEPFITGMLPARGIEGFDIIETNHANALSDLVGSSTVTGEAVFFGADAVVMADVQSPELRMGLTEDLGRFQEIGWVGIFELGLVWTLASHSRCVHVSSD